MHSVRQRAALFAGAAGSPAFESTPLRKAAQLTKDPIKVSPLGASRMLNRWQVFLRIRPLSESEKGAGEQKCMEATSEQSVVIKPPKELNKSVEESNFTFSRVFDADTSQATLFQSTGLPMVEHFLAGSSGLLFAYGNTNAGMLGLVVGGLLSTAP
jgi:hypothetical protein